MIYNTDTHTHTYLVGVWVINLVLNNSNFMYGGYDPANMNFMSIISTENVKPTYGSYNSAISNNYKYIV